MSSKFSYNPKSIKKVAVISLILVIFMTIGNLIERDKKYEIKNSVEETKTQAFEDEPESEKSTQISGKTYEKIEESIDKTIFVDIIGEVKVPNVIEVKSEERLGVAIEKAGGLTLNADRNAVNMAQKLVDGAQYIIPQKGKEFIINYSELKASVIEDSVIDGKGSPKTKQEEEDSKVNINTASKDKLQELPGVGEVISQRIIDYRNQNGEFKSIEGLLEVSGIGEKKFGDIKNNICI